MIQQSIREIHRVGDDTPELICPPGTSAVLAPRGLWIIGLSDAGRGYCMSRPSPERGQLLVCTGGAGRVLVDGKWNECRQGQAYISPPGAPSAFETQSSRRWKIVWVFFEGTRAAMPGAMSLDRSTLVTADPRPLSNAVEGLYREAVGHGDLSLLDRWADLVHTYALRIVRAHNEGAADPLWNLWAEVDARPATDWSVGRLAELAGMSGESLRKLCLEHVGRSPMQHVTHLRMRRADTLLQTSGAKLAVIARRVGYDNVFAFSTAFRRVFNAPPSARRKQKRWEAAR